MTIRQFISISLPRRFSGNLNAIVDRAMARAERVQRLPFGLCTGLLRTLPSEMEDLLRRH